jgi:hypothetical protein
MSKGRNFTARIIHLSKIDVGNNEARFLTAIGQHLPPRVNNQRMAKGIALPGVTTTLSRGDNVTAGLNGTGPK